MPVQVWREKKEIIPYYLTSFFAAAFCGIYAERLSDHVLRLLLWPHAAAVEIFFNIKMLYVVQQGYVTADLPMRIGSECSGVGFMCLVFLMLACMFVHRFATNRKWIWIVSSALVSFVSGTLLTSMRIIGSIPLLENERFPMFHAGIGICIYSLGLIVLYNTADRVSQKIVANGGLSHV